MSAAGGGRQVVAPDALDLETPGRRDYWVAIEHDSLWGSHLVPLTVIVGAEAEPGRGLVAFGGTHGNEYEGPLALKHLLAEIDPATVRGRLILVPVLNPSAFRSGTRDSVQDDGGNLNRAFVTDAGRPGPAGSVTYRLAAFVRAAIWPHVHAVIDLHAGGEVARFAPGASFHAVADARRAQLTEAIAAGFGLPLVIVYQNETPGLLTSDAETLGKIAIGAELGWGTGVHAAGVASARRGVLGAAIRLGQMHGEAAPFGHAADGTQRRVEMIDRACFTVSPVSGHFEPLVPCGAMVAAGEAVGLVHDFERIDAAPWPARAGVDGVVVAQAWGAPVRQGQQVVVVGRLIAAAEAPG
jgi:N-alpha-acetyl-L-2,4-diaminobutyrate deacetylase